MSGKLLDELKLPLIRISAKNINTGNLSFYRSISKCSIHLYIDRNLICDVLNRKRSTVYSKKYKDLYTFRKVD